MKATCHHCQYWVAGRDPVIQRGQCRRFPPPGRGNGVGEFPQTHATHWCGEHKQKTKGKNEQEQTERTETI